MQRDWLTGHGLTASTWWNRTATQLADGMTQAISSRYRRFAEVEAHGQSPCYEIWATGVAEDQEVLRLLSTLTVAQQQPNLVFAAARWCGAQPGSFAALRHVVLADWGRVRAVIQSRTTQTNEPGRCAVLLPILQQLTGPLALLEVGAAAGLCLYPDRYSYRYSNGVEVDPEQGPSRVVLPCSIDGPVPLGRRMPQIVWRAGIDLNPLDPRDPDAMKWLETLVWPEQDDRRTRLRSAVQIAAEEPVRIERGDLNELLPALAAAAPADATLVIFHSAVLNYLHDRAERRRFASTALASAGHWISYEGRGVVDVDLPQSIPTPDTLFVLSLNGQAQALGNGHGHALTWIA